MAQKAHAGELRLYIPSVCLTEARPPLRKKFDPSGAARSVRTYLSCAQSEGVENAESCVTVRSALDRFQQSVSKQLERVEERLESLLRSTGIEVFPLDDQMLARTVDLATLSLNLMPFDQAILAAVLVRTETLRDQGELDVCFCEADRDLQPWGKNGDVAMKSLERRASFPEG